MKKIICVLLTATMLLALCACGGDTKGTLKNGGIEDTLKKSEEAPEDLKVAEIEKVPGSTELVGTDKEQVPEQAVSEDGFDIGSVSGGVYENKFFGFGCALDANWTYATEEQLLSLIGDTAELFQEGDFKEGLKNADMFYDMQVASNDGYANINVVIQNLGLMYGTIISEETIVELNVQQLPAVMEQAGMILDVCEPTTVQFAGAERNTIRIHSVQQGVDIYQIAIVVKNGSYVALTTVTSFVNDITEDIAAMFYAVK